eukprot:15453703-Alexandrium_andersonii.AAC.1
MHVLPRLLVGGACRSHSRPHPALGVSTGVTAVAQAVLRTRTWAHPVCGLAVCVPRGGRLRLDP